MLRRWNLLLALAALAPAAAACVREPMPSPKPVEATETASTTAMTTTAESQGNDAKSDAPTKTEIATFGAGCFWCVEAVYQEIDGVLKVESGYMGGTTKDPTYEEVCTGTTGHAEVVQVTFDPSKVSFGTILDWFWKLHDPTTLNRQGNDFGTQYRSVVFWHSPAQRDAAAKAKSELNARRAFLRPVVTEIAEAGPFYKAERYHQNYYRQNRAAPYCRAVITPKMKKLGFEK